MHAAALQARTVQKPPQFGSRILLIDLWRPAVAPELDRPVADLTKGFECAWHVAGKFAAHSVELETDRDGSRFIRAKEAGPARAHTQSATHPRANELSSCSWHVEL